MGGGGHRRKRGGKKTRERLKWAGAETRLIARSPRSQGPGLVLLEPSGEAQADLPADLFFFLSFLSQRYSGTGSASQLPLCLLVFFQLVLSSSPVPSPPHTQPRPAWGRSSWEASHHDVSLGFKLPCPAPGHA